MDLATLSWSDVCCEKLGISLKSLPEIRSNSEVLGTVNSGPMAGIPIAGCLGDQQAALLGVNFFSLCSIQVCGLVTWTPLAALDFKSIQALSSTSEGVVQRSQC